MAAPDDLSDENKRTQQGPAANAAPAVRSPAPGDGPAQRPAGQQAQGTQPQKKPAARKPEQPADEAAKAQAKRNLSLVPFPERRERPNQTQPKRRSIWKALPRAKQLRHTIIAWTFALMVVLPVSVVSGYLVFIAQDQYHSDVSFAVRSIEGGSAAELMGFFTQTATGDPISDSYILVDYIRSREMYEKVAEDIDLQKVFARRGADWYFSMAPDLSIESQVDYWNRMVNVEFDSSSGIVSAHVRAFNPEDAQRIAESILRHSSALVNDLSYAARQEIVEAAREEVEMAEDELRSARAAIAAYRDRTQEIDPTENAKLAAQLIGGLEQELARLNTDLSTALSQMGPDTPRVRVLRQRIASIEQQIAAERERLGSGTDAQAEPQQSAQGEFSGDVADRLQDYARLKTEEEFAQQAYLSALASLRSAIADAQRNHRYLATFLPPNVAQESEYPRRLLLILLTALGFGFFWSMGVMLYYNMKDRA